MNTESTHVSVPEIARLADMPVDAVRRRLDLMPSDLVIKAGRMRAVSRDRLPVVLANLKRAPFARRGSVTIAEAFAQGA